jgi:hypothetical protein
VYTCLQCAAQALRALVQVPGVEVGKPLGAQPHRVAKRPSSQAGRLTSHQKECFVYDPDHGEESDPLLMETLQAVLAHARNTQVSSAHGEDSSHLKIADVVYSLLPASEDLYNFGERSKWRPSRMVRNKVVRNCIVMELAARTRAGYLPLFKRPATWSPHDTTVSKWSQALGTDANALGNLAAFAWFGDPADEAQTINCLRLVEQAIFNGVRHAAAGIGVSLLDKDGHVPDGLRAVLEGIPFSTAVQHAPEGACIVPLALPLRLPEPMEIYLRTVKSMFHVPSASGVHRSKMHTTKTPPPPPPPTSLQQVDSSVSLSSKTGEDTQSVPRHRPPQKRQKTVLTVSALLVPGDADAVSAPGTHSAIAAVGVPKSQMCTAAAAAPLMEQEGMSE